MANYGIKKDVIWSGTSAHVKIMNECDEKTKGALTLLQKHIKEMVSRQGTTEMRSNPGEYPHKITGIFASSIIKSFTKETHTGFVGSTDIVGMWLEFGTYKMKPRPWLSLGIREC